MKSNIGHLESAAGIAGLTKVLLQMRHGQLAPSLHSAEPNPEIDFAATPFTVQQELADWPRRTAPGADGRPVVLPRTAGVSSFGGGGANAHVVVEEYLPERERTGSTAGPQLLVVSARTPERLREQAGRLADSWPTPPPRRPRPGRRPCRGGARAPGAVRPAGRRGAGRAGERTRRRRRPRRLRLRPRRTGQTGPAVARGTRDRGADGRLAGATLHTLAASSTPPRRPPTPPPTRPTPPPTDGTWRTSPTPPGRPRTDGRPAGVRRPRPRTGPGAPAGLRRRPDRAGRARGPDRPRRPDRGGPRTPRTGPGRRGPDHRRRPVDPGRAGGLGAAAHTGQRPAHRPAHLRLRPQALLDTRGAPAPAAAATEPVAAPPREPASSGAAMAYYGPVWTADDRPSDPPAAPPPHAS
ncbi:hypothetical protein O1L55_09605 [Streptomyces albulus]|nr:hypothetical protein [Streptomyces noursei]